MEYTVGSSPRRVAAANNNSRNSRRGGSSIGSASSQSSSPSIPMSYSTDTSADRLVAGASPLATTATTSNNEQGGGGEITVKALSAAYDLPPAYDLHRSSENNKTAPPGKKYTNYNNNTTTNNNANANSNSTATVGGRKGEPSSSLLAGSMNGFGSFGTSASSSKYTTEDSLGDSYYLGEDDDEDNETNLHSSVASLSMSSPNRSGSDSRIGANVQEGGKSSVMDFFSNNTQHNDTTTTQNNSNSNSNNNNASRYTNNEGSTAVEDVTTIIRQNYNTLLTILSNPEAFTDDNSNSNVMMVEHIKQQTQQSTNKYRIVSIASY